MGLQQAICTALLLWQAQWWHHRCSTPHSVSQCKLCLLSLWLQTFCGWVKVRLSRVLKTTRFMFNQWSMLLHLTKIWWERPYPIDMWLTWGLGMCSHQLHSPWHTRMMYSLGVATPPTSLPELLLRGTACTQFSGSASCFGHHLCRGPTSFRREQEASSFTAVTSSLFHFNTFSVSQPIWYSWCTS